MDDTVYKLQKRVEDYSEEAQVYQEGDDRITVEIPGVTDANKILEDLGKPGSLEFQDESGNVVLDGSDIAGADGGVTEDQTTGSKQYVVELTLTKDGTTKFAEATAANLKKRISIVYDGETISSPVVQSVISDGKAQISGQQSIEEAKELASIIRIGSLKLELEELRSNVVGAQLGTAGNQDKPDRRCHRSGTGWNLYDYRVRSAGCGSCFVIGYLYRTGTGNAECFLT